MKIERELFVKKYREVFKVDKSLSLNNNGEFIDEFCQSVYEIWQSRVPEGYVIVPVEPTERMLDAARRRQWDDLSSPLEDMDMLKYKAMIGAAP